MTPSELLKKYNVPGPRYTSYPTVPYWNATPSEAQWLDTIRASLDSGGDHGVSGTAIYVHIPFCQSLCTYCGCNTRITRNRSVALPYVAAILKELDFYLERLGGGKNIILSELHLGGGTPTYLTPDELDILVSGILSRVKLNAAPEFSIEADPRVTTMAHLETLSRLGFSRLSLGIQDFDGHVQEIVHRTQTEEQVRVVTEAARLSGFVGVNYDLVYGLPFQTKQSIEQTIEAVCRLKPDRIAFYAYAHVPWIKPGQRRFTEADLPSGDEKRALYELGRELLEKAGFREIGMDHFAVETDSLWMASQAGALHRNFMGYTSQQVSPLIGLGVSSIGDSWRAFAQNEKHLEAYMARIEKGELPILRGHLLDEEDLVLRRHILNLMTRFETAWSADKNFTSYLDVVPAKLEEFIDDSLVKLVGPGDGGGSDGKVTCNVLERGRPFLRNICMAFDARLSRQAPKTELFSKTI